LECNEIYCLIAQEEFRDFHVARRYTYYNRKQLDPVSTSTDTSAVRTSPKVVLGLDDFIAPHQKSEARILIADPSALVRIGVAAIVRKHWPALVVEVATFPEALNAVCRETWDLVVADVSLAQFSHPDLIAATLEFYSDTAVLILANQPTYTSAKRVLRMGAKGYVSKCADIDEITIAVGTLLQRKRYVSPDLLPIRSLDQIGQHPLPEHLSNREMQVMLGMASGKTVSQISLDLAISIKSVSTYRARVFSKLGLTTNLDLIRCAIQNGLI